MPANRRVSPIMRPVLPMVLAALVVGSCGAPPPGPTATVAPPSAGHTAPSPDVVPERTSAATRTDEPGITGVPRIIVRSPSSTGVEWWVTKGGWPGRWTPLQLPFTEGDLGPAAPDGRILMTGDGRIIVGGIDGSAVKPTMSVPMPSGQALLPACYAGDGRIVLADAETLDLLELIDGGTRPFARVPLSRGACAPLEDGWTLVAVDGGGLVAVRPDAPPVSVTDAVGRHLSGGGGRVALTDPSTEGGAAAVRRATVSERGLLGPEIGRVVGQTSERVIDAQLSPDGGWLAVTLERATDAGSDARLRLYRVTGAGLTDVATLEVEVGSRVTLLPGD